MLDERFKLIMKRRLANDSFWIYKLNSQKYWLWNTLLKKSFQANFVFKDQPESLW